MLIFKSLVTFILPNYMCWFDTCRCENWWCMHDSRLCARSRWAW